MFSHVMVASNDIDRSKKFYDALFAAVGGKPGEQDAKGRLRYVHNGGVLMVSKPIDGKPATHSNGGTIGLSMASPEQAAAWHKAGVANGGTAIEDPPGLRGQVVSGLPPRSRRQQALCASSAGGHLTVSAHPQEGPPGKAVLLPRGIQWSGGRVPLGDRFREPG